MIGNLALFVFISPLLGLAVIVCAALALVFWIKVFQFLKVDIMLSNLFEWVEKVLQ